MENKLTEVLLKALPFKHLDHSELQMLVTYSQVLKFKPQQLILKQGKYSDGLYVVIKGKALVFANVLGKKKINLALLTQGNFFGEVSLIAKTMAPVSVVAEDEVECVFINASYFDMLTLFLPKIKQKILQALAIEILKRIKSLYHKISTILIRSPMMTSPHLSNLSVASKILPEVIEEQAPLVNIATIRQLPMFKFLNEIEFPEFWEHTQIIRAVKHCPLIVEGDDSEDFYIILHGAVQASIVQAEKTAKLSVLGPLDMFGCFSLLDQSKALVNFTTCEDSLLLKLPLAALNFLREKHPVTWHLMFNAICKSYVMLEESANKLHVRLNNEFYNQT